MAIQIQGNGGAVAEVDGTTFRALRVTARPLDFGSLGTYSLAQATGTIAAGLATSGELWQFRWTDATRLGIVSSVRVSGGANVAATAAAIVTLELILARGWTAAGSGGATATLTGNNQKLRTSMGTTLLGEARIATTAALGAGTKTLDAQAASNYTIGIATGALTTSENFDLFVPTNMLDAFDPGAHPVVLAQNEGVVVRNGAVAFPTALTWGLGVTARWTEVTAY